MLFQTRLCGVVVIIYLQIVVRRSFNMCVQTVEMKNDSGGAFSDRSFKDRRNNLIYFTDFNASNDMQQICYERMMLMNITAMVNKFRTFRQLNPDVVKIIQQLRIQKRRKRGRRGGHDKDYLDYEKIGLFVAIETWFKSDIESQLRVQGSVLNTNCYRIALVNRQSRLRGGGLALIYKDTLDCKLIEKGQLHTFEYANWDILGHNMTLSLLAIYHPPPSSKHRHTVNEFVTEFVNLWLIY